MPVSTTRAPCPARWRQADRLPDMNAPGLMQRFFTLRVGAMLWRNTVVSTGVFVLGLGVLWLLVEYAGMDEVIAAGISFLIANSLHYLLGRSWIFAGSDRRLSTGYAIFLVNAGVGLLVTMGLYWALLNLTPINYLAARIIVSVFAGLIVFGLNAALNFRQV